MFTACARKTSRYVLSAHHCNSYNLNPDVITGCRPSTFRQGLKAAVDRADFTAHTTYYHPRCSSSRNFQLPNTLVTHTAPPLAWYFAASPSRFNFNTHLAAHRTCNPRATRSDQHPSRHLPGPPSRSSDPVHRHIVEIHAPRLLPYQRSMQRRRTDPAAIPATRVCPNPLPQGDKGSGWRVHTVGLHARWTAGSSPHTMDEERDGGGERERRCWAGALGLPKCDQPGSARPLAAAGAIRVGAVHSALLPPAHRWRLLAWNINASGS
ncbi:hypothetical protein LXA43DRAFT_192281 [Ganoderma leucocontextum]|nr:hypothetical protein LXA43DRAFT_192281 [Ganoderma leucocontextum]